MKPRELLAFAGVDEVWGVDWETYYDDEYSLKKMATTEYVTDPRFAARMVSVQRHDQKRAKVLTPAQFKAWAKTVNWKRAGMLGHHTQFDGLICSHHFKVKPAFMLDTMSMGRALLPITVGDGLDAMSRAFGLEGKQGGEILEETKGTPTLTAAEFRRMAKYAGQDIEQTWLLFWKLLPFTPPDELHVIDITVRMYTDPILRVNRDAALAVVAAEVERKAGMLDALRKSLKRRKVKAPEPLEKALGSPETFADMLRGVGIEPPMKVSPTVAKRLQEGEQPAWPDDFVYAFALGDQEFKDLLKHPDEHVRALVEARVAVKSTNLEKKAEKFAERALLGAVPAYLKYSGAKTHRWSGADNVNWQNMNRGSGLRRSIHAPEGYLLIIADQAQIEDRLNCWYTGQTDVLEAYARGEDNYAKTASTIYGFPVDKDKNPRERFVGKTLRLGGGYQAGGPRIGDMLRLGQFGPPVYVTDEEAEGIKVAYRQASPFIVNGWRETQTLVRSAFCGRTIIEHRHGIVYEGSKDGKTGFIHHMPTGMSIRYDGLQVNAKNELSYISEYFVGKKGGVRQERTKLYGGILTENRTQFMARQLLAFQMVRTKLKAPKRWQLRHAMTTHDEVLIVVKKQHADRALEFVKEQMLTAPPWRQGLPFGVDAMVSDIYEKE
ncbi:MAG: hypothetical protein GX856_00450 [Gammaproteobacteria bacterium]|nr:hypothetical protein [Gammaproteobacteria bacterium]